MSGYVIIYVSVGFYLLAFSLHVQTIFVDFVQQSYLIVMIVQDTVQTMKMSIAKVTMMMAAGEHELSVDHDPNCRLSNAL